jgi:hypothetical protein
MQNHGTVLLGASARPEWLVGFTLTATWIVVRHGAYRRYSPIGQ